MSEPKPTYHTHDIREWGDGYWIFMSGERYRKLSRQEALAHRLQAEPVEDAVAVVKRVVGKMGTESDVGVPIVGAWGEPAGGEAGQR